MPGYYHSKKKYEECHPCFEPKFYKASLTPGQEVDFVLSDACGKFIAKSKGCVLHYKLSAFCIDKVVEAHIHLGCPGQNGPIVATLFPCGCPTGPVNGTLVQDCLNECDLEGPLRGKPMKKLFKLMDQGKAYVNVHTTTYPAGEIRGQIKKKHCHRH